MTIFPSNLTPLIDADILRYELGFAAETGWKTTLEDPDALPPFDYVAELLHARLEHIKTECNTTVTPILYLTEGRTFRFDIAKSKPYKGTRVVNKPWHYNNLSVYLKDVLNAKVITGIEADDALAIAHLNSNKTTILVSRDKDLRQIPGWFYSWELGKQPSFGPILIDQAGSLNLSEDHKKLTGTGLAFFYAQVLMGDKTDNIPGLPGCGPVDTYNILTDMTIRHEYAFSNSDLQLYAVEAAYAQILGENYKEYLLEQGQLCWITRKMNKEYPILWKIGMTE